MPLLNSMNNIAVIPARSGSKRLPGKNVMLLNGIPLIAYSILEAQRHPEIISQIYVSTDDKDIATIARSYGALVIDRPAALAGDLEPTVTAVKHVLESIEVNVDFVFLLQPTNPLRPLELLPKAFDFLLKNDVDSLMTVSRDEHKLGKVIEGKFVPFNYKLGQRSQDLEPLYYENGLLYISKPELIMQGTIIGENHMALVVEHQYSQLDIDTKEHFEYAEYLLKKQPIN